MTIFSKPAEMTSRLPSIPLGGILIVVLLLLIFKFRNVGTRDKDLPPGPDTTLVLGNALGFPTSFPQIKFLKWSQQYGDIFSLKIFDRTVIVVSSAAAVKHVLDTNGARTGNRPQSKIVHRATNGLFIALNNMESPLWKHGRQAIHRFFTKDSLEKHRRILESENPQFMHDILEDPANLYHHICRTTVSVTTSLVYGSRVLKYKGSVAERFFRGTKLLSEATDPGAHPPIDLVWPLQYVPKRWAYWKRLADSTRAIRDELYGSLHAQCELAVEEKNLTGCYIESLLLDQSKSRLTRDQIIAVGTVMMDGGAETTASFIQSFILTLLNNQEIQKKGQDEVDNVVGHTRWPRLEDYENVPYIRAIVDEVLRFRTVLPIALPHFSTEELYYKGYRIPEDSIIFMNTHGIYHDPDLFDNPQEFKPERFLIDEFGIKLGADKTAYRNNFAFGAGRRICPGETMARRSIALTTMNLLWAFDFRKDASGTGGLDFDSYQRPGLELAPKEFTCDVRPRSMAKADMIKDRYLKSLSKETSRV